MWFTNALLGKQHQTRTRKRTEDRFTSDLLHCPLGGIVNLSATGMRVSSPDGLRLKVGQVLNVPITAPEGRISLRARVVWSRRQGFRGCEAGLMFLETRPGLGRALRSLAQYGFIAQPKLDPAPSGASSAVSAKPEIPAKIREAYGILGVKPSVGFEEMRAAYRRLARQYHPDVNRAPDAADKFHQVTLAYHTLRDAAKATDAATPV